MKYIYNADMKILKAEIKYDTKSWRDFGGINIMKMTWLQKAIKRLDSLSIKIPKLLLKKLEETKNNLKMCMEV